LLARLQRCLTREQVDQETARRKVERERRLSRKRIGAYSQQIGTTNHKT